MKIELWRAFSSRGKGARCTPDLSRSHKISLISNGWRLFGASGIFDASDFSTFFPERDCLSGGELRKPDARIFHHDVRSWRSSLLEAPMSGTTCGGYSSAGAMPGFDRFLPRRLSVCSSADAICEDIGELPAVIEKLANRNVR